jgi:hypothetical protein
MKNKTFMQSSLRTSKAPVKSNVAVVVASSEDEEKHRPPLPPRKAIILPLPRRAANMANFAALVVKVEVEVNILLCMSCK